MDVDVAEFRSKGADAIVTKPVKLAQVVSTLKQLLPSHPALLAASEEPARAKHLMMMR